MKLKVVELFSGIGAWAKALENLNIDHEVVLAADYDEYPVTAYNAIHESKFGTTDIYELNEKEVPNCDLVCYSPQCQAFSFMGKQEGFEDTKGRGLDFFESLRIIKHKKPKYAIMENVKGLVSKKFEYEFSVMLEELEKAGYNNYIPDNKVINALNLNFPQNRERVFIVSIRKDIDNGLFSFPEKQKLTDNLLNYLEFDADLPILHNIYGGFKEKNARVFSFYSPTIRTSAGGGHIPSVILKEDIKLSIVGDIWNDKEPEIYKSVKENTRKAFKIAHKVGDKYFIEKENYKEFIKNNRDKMLQNDYFIIRQLTTLEAFKLMGYTKEDYTKAKIAVNNKFHNGKNKSDTRLYRMAGNSIVVKMCESIFEELFKFTYYQPLSQYSKEEPQYEMPRVQ